MCFFKSKPCDHNFIYVHACVPMGIHVMDASIHATVGSTIIATLWNAPILTIV
jgi:hypothetical protein